ncbi:MAG TPA: beta-ketoacyl synthase N-terminal-like domain-containing protein [Phycisphaerales bacterium]|nr:beta-ketoacyl synthase N-terminal-like domain-containing protein [Phycisphaerales bacterium]
MPQRRVVITGIGAVSGLGLGADALFDGLVAGRTGVGPITRFDPGGFECRLAGEVKDFSAKDRVPKSYRKAVKVMARDIELAVGAAKFAVEDAGIATRGMVTEGQAPATTYPAERVGCHIGAGLIAAETDELSAALVTARAGAEGEFSLKSWGTATGADGAPGAGAMNNLPPLWMLKYLPNMLACHVTIIHGCEGPSNTITCAEASGLLSIGESLRVIERDDADLCFSGGAESKVNLMGMLRMHFAGRLAPTGDSSDPTEFVKPFDPASAGSVVGEGGGILLLEEYEKARARGAKMHAEVVGFGAAHSQPIDWASGIPSTPVAVDEGLQYAIENALGDAGLAPGDIDAIVPHGAGVRWMDTAEQGALAKVFGDRLAEIPVVAVTPNIGSCNAGMGGILAVVAAMCISRQQLPAQLNAGNPSGLRAGARGAEQRPLKHVLACCGSLGGQNAAVILKRID